MRVNTKSFVFICGETWESLFKNGYKTRKGALLRSLINTKMFDRVLFIVETGFRGGRGQKRFIDRYTNTEIIEIQIPTRMPSFLVKIFGDDAIIKNFQLEKKSYELIIKTNKINFIWAYSIDCGNLIKSIKNAILIFDIIDFRTEDPTLSQFSKYIYRKSVELAINKADIITYNSPVFLSPLPGYQKYKCLQIRNGIDGKRFNKTNDLKRNKDVVFIGAISRWLDLDLIKELALKNPDIKFDYYGFLWNGGEIFKSLLSLSNIKWYGPVDSDQVPLLLAKYKVAIVPYNPKVTWKIMGDSMKIFEYLASETPVISTNFQPRLIERFNGLIHICNTHDEFNEKLLQVLGRSTELKWRRDIKRFIKSNSWECRINDIFTAITRLKRTL